jgi:hypothetical protein
VVMQVANTGKFKRGGRNAGSDSPAKLGFGYFSFVGKTSKSSAAVPHSKQIVSTCQTGPKSSSVIYTAK